MKVMFRLFALYKPYSGWIIMGILVSSLTVLANVALMAISGWFIASMALCGQAGISMNYFTPAAMIRASAILRTGGRYAERLITHEATLRLLAELRVWFYSHLEPLAPAGLEAYRSGDLLSRIRADIDTLDNFYIRVIVPIAVAIIGVVVLTLVMAVYDFLSAFVLLSLLLMAGVVLPLWVGKLGRSPGKRLVEISAALRTSVVDGVQGIAELTICGANHERAQQISSIGKELILVQERMSQIGGLSQSGMLLSANLAGWAVVLITVPLVDAGTIQPQELAMLALFALAAFESVMPLPEAFRMLGQTITAASRLFEIVDRETMVQEPEDGKEIPQSFHLRFESVNFRYSAEAPLVLHDIDLDLAPGKKVAVVGASGSGKSSMIQLLLRFRAPVTGRILLGDTDLSNYKGEKLRDWIAVVPQQSHLFNTTIRENLKIANPDVDQQVLERVCRVAQIHDFIVSQPEGYDTWVGEAGVKLSGGQIRRITIARALVRDFRLMVLDEPGEGLDTATQQALMDELIEFLDGRSLLLITHHSIGLDKMDKIMLLDSGRMVEQSG